MKALSSTSILFLVTLSSILISSLSSAADTEKRLNGRQAADRCKQEISAQYSAQSDENAIRFSRNPASSLKGDAYKFWINTTEEAAGDKNSIKYLCEITRTGELVGLSREQGRWRI